MTKEPTSDEEKAELAWIGKLPPVTKQERFFLVHLLGGGAREVAPKTTVLSSIRLVVPF